MDLTSFDSINDMMTAPSFAVELWVYIDFGDVCNI
jgi:hypothetical protein